MFYILIRLSSLNLQKSSIVVMEANKWWIERSHLDKRYVDRAMM